MQQLLGTTRLLTLIGAGGVGKTRLAQEVCADVADEVPDGVWHVELASLSDPSLVPHAVAAVLGIRDQPGRSTTEVLVSVLSSRTLLLVLDNCEHLASACAALCVELLRGCPQLSILTTSRQALGASGETTWYVPSMDVPGPGASSLLPLHVPGEEGVEPSEAVQLFAARAAAARPTFRVTLQNAPTVGDICRRLDGIPLAIELAAARVKVLTVEQIAARLDDRFALLTGGSEDALPRHQTLRALVDWSFELLDGPERILFRRLGVFAGGCSLEAVEAVCAGDGIGSAEILDLLTRLVDRSLVIPEEFGGAMRYRLLETMRAYGHELRVAAGEDEVVRDRHLAWFRDLAVRSEEEFVGPDEPEWVRVQRLEEGNFRAALDWSRTAATEDRLDAGMTLAGSLWRFWDMQGKLGEGSVWANDLLARSDPARDSLGRAKALLLQGYAGFFQRRDVDGTVACWSEALRIARAFHADYTVAVLLWGLGFIYVIRSEEAQATRCLDELADLGQKLGSALMTGVSIYWRGELAFMRGDEATAVAAFEESYNLIRQTDDRWYLANAMPRLAQLALSRGDFTRAKGYYGEIVKIMSAFDDVYYTAMGLVGLGWTASEEGAAERAARIMGGAEALNEAVGMPSEQPLPYFHAAHERAVELARAQLGDDAFRRAWAEGRALPLALLLREALDDQMPGVRHPTDADDVDSNSQLALLSTREREVATLIAQGRTNAQIAGELVISRLTAGTHVRNILRKLGFTSRAQIAYWAARQPGIAERD